MPHDCTNAELHTGSRSFWFSSSCPCAKCTAVKSSRRLSKVRVYWIVDCFVFRSATRDLKVTLNATFCHMKSGVEREQPAVGQHTEIR